MADFNIDRIKFRWKGTWAESTSYIVDDVVLYNGRAYVCTSVHTSAASFYTNENNWELMLDGYEWKGDWTTSTFYSLGNIVKYNGYVYRCIEQHTSTVLTTLGLPTDISKWTLVATTPNWTSVWTTSTYYNLGDVVRYNGNVYICNTKHQSNSVLLNGLEADETKWNIVSASDNWKADWQTGTRYIINDVVKYGGIVYRCTQDHSAAGDVVDGLELDSDKWEIVNSGIEFKFNWAQGVRYKLNDIVDYGSSLYICNDDHVGTTSFQTDESEGKWSLWLPGLGFESVWDAGTHYTKGDLVLYGGYTYAALQNNTGSAPSADGLIQNTGNWELVTTGYKHVGEWNTTTNYKTGDVVRHGGNLYVAILDSTNSNPNSNPLDWTELITGKKYRSSWDGTDDTLYNIGDIVLDKGTSYVCIGTHTSTDTNARPSVDVAGLGSYWEILVQGSTTNVLSTPGDILDWESGAKNPVPIGSPGESLKSNSVVPRWGSFGQTPKVYFVSTQGTDDLGFGLTENAPFRSVKYACDYILQDQASRAPATVYVKTGFYEEILPIRVPADVAVVGDELRSTIISAASEYEQSDMFYVRNGSGIRNLTLQGLSGVLGSPNEFLTSRPSAGAYVSLDPGTGTDDQSVWITSKSCYVQNVTTFGTACVGLKIDGSLHNGGNKSIVANDFTQVLDDGIGVWANNDGLSELVSVFTYFCHIGYLCTDGGKLRATNGNNSYGTYGSVAEGSKQNEDIITAVVNNRNNEAQVGIVHNNGNEILAVGYSHGGQNYTSATMTFVGSGIDAAATMNFVNGGVSNIRIKAKGDSTIPGGINYTHVTGTAQTGDATSITIEGADLEDDNTVYEGLRIFLTGGRGVGQYAKIDTYNTLTKVATVVKESDGTPGWEQIDAGRAIETTLNLTTAYSIEPLVEWGEVAGATKGWARANIVNSRIADIWVYDPGSSYSVPPTITIVDNQNTVDAVLEVLIGDGVLGVPTFTNRGIGWVRSSATIAGDGFAEEYQTGQRIRVSGLTREPGPGDNVSFDTITDAIYRLVKVENVSGTEPNLEADILVYPTIEAEESPSHDEQIIITQFYSQVRLTGHDFLDIGTGNVNSTKYPNLYLEGIDSDNAPQPQNEVQESAGGRVFYTSTDQDGNFRVGELFEVEQATGVVSVNASQFDLTGLTELSLGGISVGGTAVVIREFSKDATFALNSNNIVPTQAAIVKYLNTRISGGTADAITSKLIAGTVTMQLDNVSAVPQLDMPSLTSFSGGVSGNMLAMYYFKHRSNRDLIK